MARFPLPLDGETDWHEMFNGQGGSEGQRRPALRRTCQSLGSHTLVKQGLDRLFSLLFLFTVAAAFSFTHSPSGEMSAVTVA